MKRHVILKLFYILILLIGIPRNSVAEQDFIGTFKSLMQVNGWDVTVQQREKGAIQQLNLSYFSPNGFGGRGFAGNYGIIHVGFVFCETNNIQSISWANSEVEQIYRYQENSSRMFGVSPGSKAAYAHGLTKFFLSYRYHDQIFTFPDPVANDYGPIIELIRKYFIAVERKSLEEFKKYISTIYENDKNFYEATILLQEYLTAKNLCEGLVDGDFGSQTAEAFQKFLKKKGYYHGPIDGDFGKNTRSAIKMLQKQIGVEETGILNLATAKKIFEEM